MNEQLIKKFTSQCGIEYDSDDGADDESLRKYTELILKECIICAEREWIRHGSDSVHNKAIHKVIESIKENFGVEE